MSAAARRTHIEKGLAPPKFLPPGFELKDECFVPSKHLQLEPPSSVKTLNFETVPFPYRPQDVEDFPGLAYVTAGDCDMTPAAVY